MLAFQLRFVPILFLLICLVSRTEAQPLTYKGTYVDTVKVLSNFSYYHFDSLGTSTGEGEEYFIAFNTKRNGYFLVQHKKTSYKYINTTEVFSSQEKLLKIGKKIRRQHLASLLEQFEKGSIPRTFDCSGITQKGFFKLLNLKHIRRLAKNTHASMYFEKPYADKTELRTLIKDLRNLDTLNFFLATAYTPFPIPSDASGGIDVYIVTSQHPHHFRDSNEYLYIHHWYEFSDEKFVIPPSIVNFPIDKALIKVLPRNFYGLRSLHNQMLAIAYIAWYMKRRDIDIN